jgi:hypothetical protein
MQQKKAESGITDLNLLMVSLNAFKSKNIIFLFDLVVCMLNILIFSITINPVS